MNDYNFCRFRGLKDVCFVVEGNVRQENERKVFHGYFCSLVVEVDVSKRLTESSLCLLHFTLPQVRTHILYRYEYYTGYPRPTHSN